MFVCKNCNQTYATPAKFCTQCGGEIVQTQDYAQPSFNDYSPAYNPAPTYGYPAAPVAGGSKAPAIVGMILGIVAVIFAFVMFVPIPDAVDSYASYYIADEMLAWCTVWSIFVVPLVIVGLIMSFKAKAGRGMAIVGKITNFISVGLWALSWIMTMSI